MGRGATWSDSDSASPRSWRLQGPKDATARQEQANTKDEFAWERRTRELGWVDDIRIKKKLGADRGLRERIEYVKRKESQKSMTQHGWHKAEVANTHEFFRLDLGTVQ